MTEINGRVLGCGQFRFDNDGSCRRYTHASTCRHALPSISAADRRVQQQQHVPHSSSIHHHHRSRAWPARAVASLHHHDRGQQHSFEQVAPNFEESRCLAAQVNCLGLHRFTTEFDKCLCCHLQRFNVDSTLSRYFFGTSTPILLSCGLMTSELSSIVGYLTVH